jgi:pimeloyl-ACP methyl ester carboxylesterase
MGGRRTISRRRAILSLLGAGVATGSVASYYGLHSLPPRSAEAEGRFRRKQDALLEAAGIHAASRFVDAAEPPLRVQVLDMGTGTSDPVLLVHGGNSVAVGWLPLLERLRPRFHLLAPDRPGCGLTTPFDYQGVDLRRHGAAFIGSTLDALGVARASIIGNSMGGFFSMAFALAHPERVAKLVLIGEPAGSAESVSRFHKLVGTRGINTFLYKTALRPPNDASAVRKSMGRARLVTDPSRVPEPLLDCLAEGARLPGALVSWITMVERAFDPPGSGVFARRTTCTRALRPELPKLVAPTLFLWGEQDPFGSPDLGREMAAMMPNARVVPVSDAGHLPWLDQPEFCAERITEFLHG